MNPIPGCWGRGGMREVSGVIGESLVEDIKLAIYFGGIHSIRTRERERDIQ